MSRILTSHQKLKYFILFLFRDFSFIFRGGRGNAILLNKNAFIAFIFKSLLSVFICIQFVYSFLKQSKLWRFLATTVGVLAKIDDRVLHGVQPTPNPKFLLKVKSDPNPTRNIQIQERKITSYFNIFIEK